MESSSPPAGESGPGAERHGYVERVLGSATFANAPVLKCFLQFIVSLAEEGRSDEINEYAIATQVFGRPAKFDPASDTIVRTQAYRLRLKLKEYYEREGKDDEIAIEVPKGHYVPLFQCRAKNGSAEAAAGLKTAAPTETAPKAVPARGRPAWVVVSAAVLAAVTIFLGGAAIGARWRRTTPAVEKIPGLVAQFWGGFFNPDHRIVISFWDFDYVVAEGNILFPIGRAAKVERAVPAEAGNASDPKLAAKAGKLYFENGFAGLGDMLAVQHLSVLFSNLGAATSAVRAHQLTLEELRNSDVVFLGAFQDRGNLVWQPEHWPWRFVHEPGTELWTASIVDGAAPAGAPARFVLSRDRESGVIRTDYALVTVLPGVNPNRRVVTVAGLSTTGTQGGAEFLTSEAGLRDLLEGVGVKQDGRLAFPRYFQCVVRVEVAHGIDVMATKYVTGAAFQPKP